MRDSAGDEDLHLLRKLTILYVEDDDNVRESLLRFLKRRFGQVFSARDGREGLGLYSENSPDIVITDIQMPVMDGLEMARFIRQDHPTIPILITTAFNEPPYLKKAAELGIEKYIKKPVVKEELITSLYETARAIGTRRA